MAEGSGPVSTPESASDLAGRIGWWIGLSGIFLVAAAVVCERTGAHAVIGGSHVNTHVAGTWVLASLGVVLMGNGLALMAYANKHRSSA